MKPTITSRPARLGDLLQLEARLDRLGRRLLDEDVLPGTQTVGRELRLEPRVHGDQNAIDLRASEQLPVVGVDLGNAEVSRAAPGALLVDVTAGDELADLSTLGQLADRGSRLRRVEHPEPDARVEVLRGVAAAADEADPDEARHRRVDGGSGAANDGYEGRVEVAVGEVELVVARGRLGFGLDGSVDPDEPLDLAPGAERSDADAGGEGRAERRPGVKRQRLERVARHVRDDLLPEPRVRAAVGHPNPGRDVSAVGEDVEVVAEAERDRLEHGPEQVASPMAEMEADEGSPGFGIVDRRLLTEHVGQGYDPTRTGGVEAASASSPSSGAPPASSRWNQRMKLPDAAMHPLGRNFPGTR